MTHRPLNPIENETRHIFKTSLIFKFKKISLEPFVISKILDNIEIITGFTFKINIATSSALKSKLNIIIKPKNK
ncbi:MAG: hypothetical protein RSB67_00125 [Clostridia bacterium]